MGVEPAEFVEGLHQAEATDGESHGVEDLAAGDQHVVVGDDEHVCVAALDTLVHAPGTAERLPTVIDRDDPELRTGKRPPAPNGLERGGTVLIDRAVRDDDRYGHSASTA